MASLSNRYRHLDITVSKVVEILYRHASFSAGKTDLKDFLADRERDAAELARLQAALHGATSQRRDQEQRAEEAESALQKQQQLAAQPTTSGAPLAAPSCLMHCGDVP